MPFPRPSLDRCRPIFAALAMIVAAICAPAPAAGQVAVLVNGDPITNYEIEQRSRLIVLSTRKPPSRQETIEALIEDRLKVQIGKRFGLVLPDTEINNTFANVAKGSRATPEQFAKQLESQGLNPNTLKAKMRADLTWNQVIRGKFAGAFQFGEKDIMKALESRNQQDVGHEYLLRPIVFVVPRGSPPGVAEGRKREVDGLRTRFQDCDTGIPLARSMRDVAVRDPIRRNSADLSPQLREVLARIEVGKLTPPEVTPGGVEVFAVCEKKETSADTPAKRQVREEMFNEKFNAQGARYLKELRSGAMIEYR
jgi:peptidyl-prolyl cis-trans isomerase SurA